MPRQLIPPFEVLYDILGVAPAAGGLLYTYELGTTTPKETHADYDQTVLNTNPIELDSSGRVETPVWGDGEYTLVLTNADDEVIKTWESRPEQPAATVVPVPDAGEFVTGDGENYALATIREVPDPTGSSGRLLSNDGANSLWVSPADALAGLIPEPPESDITTGSNSARFGDYLKQWGTGSAPATGTDRTTATISFPVAFDDPPHFVGIQVTSDNITGHSLVAIAVTSITTTGCIVTFDNADRHYQGSSKIVNPVPFQWMAEGKKA